MKIGLLLLLLALRTWAVYLPPAQVGQPYSQKISSQPLSSCAVDPDAPINPGTANGLPAGLSLATNGTVSGTTSAQPITYQFGVACAEANFIVRMKVVQGQ
jgi:hypothetical protein